MKRILIVAFVIILCSNILRGQDVIIESSQEELDSADFSSLLKTYNDVIRVHEEEFTLIKIDLLGPLLYSFSNHEEGIDSVENNVIGIAFERKFRPDWSWIVATTIRADKRDITNVWLRGGVRYYYNLNNRIMKGKSANNFSSSYFSATVNSQTRPKMDDYQLSINILYGIQRRLGKFGFIDWNVGTENIPSFSDESVGIDFVTQITIGIGI